MQWRLPKGDLSAMMDPALEGIRVMPLAALLSVILEYCWSPHNDVRFGLFVYDHHRKEANGRERTGAENPYLA